MTVTVHRTVEDADREIKDTVQESFRCPAQELGGGQRLSGLMSLQFDQKDVRNADASLFEAGKFTGPDSGGTQDYVWSKSRIGPVTTAVSVKGAEGYQNSDLLRIAAEGGAKVLTASSWS
ncbi:Lipoprotein OS=Streptomyces microflavus OX=1919 GN=Smic_69770 PE=4 SV=1 [Streptomyces microflavus]